MEHSDGNTAREVRISRRPAMRSGVAVLAAFAVAATAAKAATTDLVVHCDPPLAGPLRAVAVAFHSVSGVWARVFPTAPNAIPAQLVREIQNDVVMSQPDILARIGASGLLTDVPPSARWRNRLIVAMRRDDRPRAIEQATCAAPDPGWGGGPDGPALLAAAAIRPGRLIGTFDTEEARTLLLSGEVEYALLHASEMTSALVPASGLAPVADILVFAAVTRSTRRPNPEALLRYLGTDQAVAVLRASGLEPAI
jgi:hypothetical protein